MLKLSFVPSKRWGAGLYWSMDLVILHLCFSRGPGLQFLAKGIYIPRFSI